MKNLDENRLFSFRSRKALAGYLLGAVTLLGFFLCVRTPKLPWLFAPAFAAAFVIAGALRFPRESALTKIAVPVWCGIAAFSIFFACQLAVCNGFMYVKPIRLLLNLLCVALIYCFLLAITARFRLSLVLTCIPLCLLSTANYCLILFRGDGIEPQDFLHVGEALDVLPSYTFVMRDFFFLSLCLWALIIFSSFCLPAFKVQKKLRLRVASTVLCAALCVYCFSRCNAMPISYSDSDTPNSGFIASAFARTLDSMKSKVPEGYSLERIAELEEKYADSGEDKAQPDVEPHVFIIMNESFSDLSVYGSEPSTNLDTLSFFRSLRENTVRGYALSSVFASGTDHSEYAFLTGNLLEDLRANRSAYSAYINSPQYSLISALKALGYRCFATHPFSAHNYSRDKVYPLLGFDAATFLNDYPQQKLLRRYLSDQAMYDYLIQRFEEESPQGKTLFYGVSIQNHGSYDYDGPEYSPSVHLEGYDRDYPFAEQYLDMIRESDRALEHLITYFQGIDEPVVLVFFGDHQPSIETEFTQMLHGGALNTLDEEMLRYKVPFLIWANYDIEERDVGFTGLNYIAGYLWDVLGRELPPYSRFLRDMQEVIPVLNTHAYYSRSKQRFIPFEEAEGEEEAWLHDYKLLEYNSLLDIENRSEFFFPLPEVSGAK